MRNSSIFIVILVFSLASGVVRSQELSGYSHRLYDPIPHFSIKSNLLYDAVLSLNLGVEFKLSKRYTLDIPVSYNSFSFSNNRKWKHLLVQPELRYWLCESFSGHFLGIHGHYGEYNVGNIGPLKATRHHRYEGWLAGGGVSWGYHWLLSPRWSMEFTIGFGYAYIDYEKFEAPKCGLKLDEGTTHYVGPTKIGLNLIYFLK
ncbi:DUF3575 domain-containing protein [Bacteroides sp. 519]|uniref:DUF3575 domain-containing protein n=1 Tax=Bacteroides sp. 519 TaxID=2302937 RepID=UPI0013D8776B|nr:DUF3575 domain-containing protein [Bacteroides sp. 519]NDV57355.1 DUF3575 domain-containing protein [Bacteroides sp. 519]